MMCVGLMGPNAAQTTGGKVLIRSLHRAIRDMPEEELRSNLTDIRDRLSDALNTPNTTTVPGVTVVSDPNDPIFGQLIEWDDASNDLTTFANGD